MARVLARVTGGSGTTIEGTLRSAISGADLYLINPAGIMVGPDAVVDVSGSLALTTADYVKLADGGRFAADANPASSTLTVAAPTAFGFLGIRAGGSAAVRLGGNIASDGLPNEIAVPTGRTVSIVGGEVSITTRALVAPGGRIDLTAVSAAGEVPVEPPADTKIDIARGPVNLIEEAALIVDADPDLAPGSGSISLRGGPILLEGLALLSSITGDAPGGGITVFGDSLTLFDGSSITAGTDGAGRAGSVKISAADLLDVSAGSSISTFAESSGRGGDIVVSAATVILDGFGDNEFLTGITADVELNRFGTGGSGAGGNIEISATSVQIYDAAVISASTFGPGPGGDVRVTSSSEVIVDGGEFPGFTGISADTQTTPQGGASGPAGNVLVEAPSVSIFSRGAIRSNSLYGGAGPGGQVRVVAGELFIDAADSGGVTGLLTLSGARLPDDAGAERSFAGGDGGDVGVVADVLEVTGDGAGIRSSTFGDMSAGDGGSIIVEAGTIDLRNGGVLSASTFGAGGGGSVSATAGRILVRGSSDTEFTGIFARSDPSVDIRTSGVAGSVSVQAQDIRLSGRPLGGGLTGISAESTSLARAGSVTVNADDSISAGPGSTIAVSAPFTLDRAGDLAATAGNAMLVRRATVTAESGNEGGNVAAVGGRLIYVEKSLVSARAGGNGGRLSLDSSVVVLSGSILDARFQGRRVEVQVEADGFLLGSTEIRTSADLNLPRTDVSGFLVPLRVERFGGMSKLIESCTVRPQAVTSSFSIFGNSGTPLEPGGWSPADFRLDFGGPVGLTD